MGTGFAKDHAAATGIAMRCPRLRQLRFGVIKAPLNKPYDLSFASLTDFESVWVAAEQEDGRLGLGEAVPLPGYNWETLDTVRDTVAALVAGSEGQSSSTIVERCRDVRTQHPFAASAVMTALDMPLFLPGVAPGMHFPLSTPVAAEWPLPELRRVVEAQLAAGWGFIKVKVGRNYDDDVAAARCLLGEWPGRHFGVVFDANQAYSGDQALAFARELRACGGDRLQWLEQPVDRQDWDAMERVCRTRSVPVVLDECIYDDADVSRAAAIGARGVKLKLMKNFGIGETLMLARRARSRGLIVVFGNGVATDIGNLGEYLVLSAGQGMFASPGECNGFAKLRVPLLGQLLKLDARGQFSCSAAGAEIARRLEDFAQDCG
jgi:L-alanine-DL-glutamate epimerase-like enolase superfamily enzyme